MPVLIESRVYYDVMACNPEEARRRIKDQIYDHEDGYNDDLWWSKTPPGYAASASEQPIRR